MSNTEIKNAVINGKKNTPQLLKYIFLVAMLFISLACKLLQLPQRQNPSGVSSEENISEQSAESLVVRNPTEWFPEPNSLEVFKDTPFQETWSRTNEEDAKYWYLEEDILELYTKNNRIGGSGYWWSTGCQYDENVAIASGLVNIHLFKNPEGASNFFNALPEIYINTLKQFNPDMKVTPMTDQDKIGDEAFFYISPLPDCMDFEPKNIFLVFRRMNVVTITGFYSLDVIQDGQLQAVISDKELQNKLVELGNYIDKLIISEANQKFVLPPEENSSETTDITSNDPLSLLSIDLSCGGSQGTSDGFWFDVSGDIRNEGSRPIQADILLITYEDNEVYSETPYTEIIEPGVEVPISFSGIFIPDPYRFMPPDDPFTEEYEPDIWIDTNHIPEYSCDIKLEAQWKD